jgi:hypothetical protein
MRRLVYVTAAAIVPAALVATALIGYDYYDREQSRLIRDSTATARALAAAVETELTGAKSALLALATSPHLSSGDLAAFHAQALDALKDQALANVVLMDKTGVQRVNTFRPFGAPLPAEGNPPELRRIFETNEVVITDLFVGPVVGKHFLAVGVPVRRNGKVVYSLNGGVAPERLSALLAQQRLPEGWIVAVFDHAGTIVARTPEGARFVGKQGPPELVRRMKEKPEDAFQLPTLEGIPALMVFSRSPASGWTVAIGIPLSELTAHVLSSLARLVIVGFIAMLTALALAAVLGRRFLARQA